MNTRSNSPTASAGHDHRSAGLRGARFSSILPALVTVLLAALVLVPSLIGQRVDALQERRAELVFPAQQALQESRSLLTEQLAAVRGYQISGEPRYLAQLESALSIESRASRRLITLSARLGPETLAAVEEFRSTMMEWQEGPRALLAGAVTRDELARTLPLGQERIERALAAADGARAELARSDARLEDRIRAARGTVRILMLLLSFGALAAVLAMVWLTRRLRRVTRALEARAEGLRESEERFRLIAENLREMIWISDPGYTTQYYLSPIYESIWGRSIDEAKRNPRSFLEAVVPEDRARVAAALEGYARGEYAAEYRIVRPDGEIRWISGRGYPVRDEQGDIFRIAGIAEDITAQKLAEREREELLERERAAHAETEAALQLRDRVVRIVSHDLKNPLHTIGMAAELLEMPLTDEQRGKQLEIIQRTVARANRMVNDLLDAARLQSGRAISIARTPLEVQPLLAEAIEAFRFQAERKNQELSLDVPDAIPPVLGDRDRLDQALSNLLGNAVKFTPEGGRIRLTAAVHADGVSISVSDTGPGIPAELMAHLFEPFAQARETASFGTGLGLSITRGIVEAHGGAMSVESEPGLGTTFTFTIPTRDASDGTPTEHRRT